MSEQGAGDVPGARAGVPAGAAQRGASPSRPAALDDAAWADGSFEVFFRAEFPRLVALARAVCGSGAAEDLAQEAMLVVYGRWPEISGMDAPAMWARRVCLNISRSLLRRRVVEARAVVRLGTRPLPPADLDPADEQLWAAVRGLPKRQAQAVALRYVCDLEVGEIAATMGCSVGSVKVHLSRARASLARRLGMDEEVLS